VAFFSAVDIDHVLRKEPNMTCLTPSHEEKISEGISCTITDTINALSQSDILSSQNCLLGDSRETPAVNVRPESILDLLKKVNMPSKDCDLPFLKAQMYKDYKQHINPFLSGNKETEKVVKYRNKKKQQLE
jgi:DNA polymerase gamma 1